jgi:glycerophosphoryl diester phosphodiesterase
MSQEHESESPQKASRVFSLRKAIRYFIRSFKVFALVTLVLLLYVFICVEFPTETIIYGRAYNTSYLPWLQGHDQDNDETAHTPLIIGHRGKGLKSVDENILSIGNTKAAIRAAAEAHVDRIEIDIRMTEDGHLVLFHDEKLDPKVADLKTDEKTNGISDYEWKRVRELELNVATGDKQIATLTEGLEAAEKVEGYHPQWVLDIKLEKDPHHRERMKKKLLSQLSPSFSGSRLSPSNVTILGNRERLNFLYNEGEETLLNAYPCGMIVDLSEKNALNFLWNPAKWIADAKQVGADILVLPLVFVTESLINEAHDEGLQVWVWNCNQPEDQNRLKHYKVDGLIVDDPSCVTKGQ